MLTWTHHVNISADMARYVSRCCLLYQRYRVFFIFKEVKQLVQRNLKKRKEKNNRVTVELFSWSKKDSKKARKMKEIVPSKNNIVPPLSRETVIMVENIQNVTQCSEAEAVQTLFECNMDPHEAVLLILEKGSFQEVKYKQKRKKEMRDDDCIKNATGLRSPYSCRTSTLKDAAGLHSPFPTRTSSLTRGRGGGFVFYQSTSPISPFLRDPGPQKTNPLLFAQPEFAPAKNLYPCFACPEFGSFTLDALKVHNKMDHPSCKDKCNLCYNVFDTNKALLAHKKSMSHGFKNKIKIFLCVHCGSKNKTYTTMRKLRTHTWAKHGRFNYRCKLCKNLFETGRAVSVHKPSCVCAHGANVTEEDGGSDFSEIDENVEESGEEEDEE